jgi:hypothetical protein
MTNLKISADPTDDVKLDPDVATAAKAKAKDAEKALSVFLNDLLRNAWGLSSPDERAGKSGGSGGYK